MNSDCSKKPGIFNKASVNDTPCVSMLFVKITTALIERMVIMYMSFLNRIADKNAFLLNNPGKT